jgi:hypothetical protein
MMFDSDTTAESEVVLNRWTDRVCASATGTLSDVLRGCLHTRATDSETAALSEAVRVNRVIGGYATW